MSAAANKRLHWSARPENAEKALAWKKNVGRAQKGKKKGQRKQTTLKLQRAERLAIVSSEISFAERLTNLMEDMNRRVDEIDKAIKTLQEERENVINVFKTLKQD